MKDNFLIQLMVLLLFSGTAVAAPPTADEIMRRYIESSLYSGDDFQARVSMVITDKQGRTRERAFSMLRKDVGENGKQLYFVYFSKPSDIRKSTFLVHKFIDKNDDRWMYLPSLDLVKRIAASDKRTSFMGSHYYYEDISGRNIKDDRHVLVEENATAYVVKSNPIDVAAVEFSSYTLWIDKNTFLPMKAEYMDKNGQLYRVAEILGNEVIQGYPTVTKTRIRDLGEGGETVTDFANIKYNGALSEDLFSERYLRRPHRELFN